MERSTNFGSQLSKFIVDLALISEINMIDFFVGGCVEVARDWEIVFAFFVRQVQYPHDRGHEGVQQVRVEQFHIM